MTTQNVRESKAYKLMNIARACEIAESYGDGENATIEEVISAWQWLHDTGIAYKLQGFYGRTLAGMIEAGHVIA